jgi:hypothetical protein
VGAYELEGERVALDGLPYPSVEVPGRETCRLYFLRHMYLFGTPTSLLMRSEVVRSRFPFYEARYAPFEDAHACFDVLRNWNFGFVHQVLTYSRRDNESILSRIGSFGFEGLLPLAILVAHGRDYLSDEEYHRFLNDAEHQYFLFLGKSALRGGSQEFWDFHRNGLASINYYLDWRLLGKWIPLAMLDYIGNPKRTWDAFCRRWKKVLPTASGRPRPTDVERINGTAPLRGQADQTRAVLLAAGSGEPPDQATVRGGDGKGRRLAGSDPVAEGR